jgi:hypothetical protein
MVLPDVLDATIRRLMLRKSRSQPPLIICPNVFQKADEAYREGEF